MDLLRIILKTTKRRPSLIFLCVLSLISIVLYVKDNDWIQVIYTITVTIGTILLVGLIEFDEKDVNK